MKPPSGRPGSNEPAAALGPSPATIAAKGDPGDETARNYRYQYAYGVILLIAAKRGAVPYVALWCEHHEDFLAERSDGLFDGYQIKTSKPELGAWKLTDAELVHSIGRFVDLLTLFRNRIGDLFFVSNKECDNVTSASTDDRRRSRCSSLFLQHIRSRPGHAAIEPPFAEAFRNLQAECGCGPEILFETLRRVDFKRGPARGEIDAVLSHEHLGRLTGCESLAPDRLDGLRDRLVAVVHRASSLLVTDPDRHLRSVLSNTEADPTLIAKRVVVESTVVVDIELPAPMSFRFPGEPSLSPGNPAPPTVLEQKLQRGALVEEIAYMRTRELAADYHILEDIERRPDQYPALLQQIEQIVLGVCSEANLRARQNLEPYGPRMMIDVQDRLRHIAKTDALLVGGHPYDCLVGVAAMLTNDCRVWWSPRFQLNREVAT
jgi:hypothetical protein